MKVTLLQGGAKKQGNTATVLGFVQDELQSLGHEVQTIYLHDKKLKGCTGCAACKKHADSISCVQMDDMEEVLQEVIASPAVVFSSPLYFWGVNAQLKSVIDRSYSLYTQDSSLVEGQRQGLLMTGASGFENNAEEALTAFSRMQKYHKSVHAGALFVGKCSKVNGLPEDAEEQARDFARKLV